MSLGRLLAVVLMVAMTQACTLFAVAIAARGAAHSYLARSPSWRHFQLAAALLGLGLLIGILGALSL